MDLDSDGEPMPTEHNTSKDVAAEELNYEVAIKISWFGEIERHQLKKHQPFGDLMKIFAEREATGISNVIFMIDDKVLNATDTPDSVNYRVSHIIYW